MLNNSTAYKYETPYKGPFLITQCCTNAKVTLLCGVIISRHNIRCIKPHTSDTKVADITPENIYDNANI